MKSYDELSAIVKSIEPVLRENAAEAEAKCSLPQAAVDAVRKAGLFKLWVPESLGGWQVDPVTSFRVFEDISAIDSAAGWLVSMSAAISGLGLFLGDRAVEEMYKGGNNIFADGSALRANPCRPTVATSSPVSSPLPATASTRTGSWRSVRSWRGTSARPSTACPW
jgi:hypothetical protein